MGEPGHGSSGTLYNTAPLKRFNVVKSCTMAIFKDLEAVVQSSEDLLEKLLQGNLELNTPVSPRVSRGKNARSHTRTDKTASLGTTSNKGSSWKYGSITSTKSSKVERAQAQDESKDGVRDEWVTKDKLATMSEMHRTVTETLPIIERDTMKVVFVGHTSNGKSSTINAMLYSKVMPTSFGHTTNAFISVRGTSEKPYIMVNDGHERRDLASSETLGQVLSDLTRAGVDDNGLLCSEVAVYWDKVKCRLLEHDITIIDTPGLDLAENYDRWLDTYCFDADVFVLVANAEATVKYTEMTFLQRVNQRVANPNLFILFNRWDAADDADDIDKVKAQHLERARELLVDELDASTNEDDAWKKLVYFVSAREAFAIRSGKLSADKQVGVQERYNSFESFEKAFEEKVSQSAIRTKFDNNLNRGHEILDVVMAASSELNERLESQSKARSDQITAMLDSIMKVERMQSRLTSTCKDLLEKLEQDLEAECDSALASWLFFDFPDFVEKFDYANFHKADDPDKTMYTRRLAEMSVDNLLDTLTSSRSKGFVLHLVETLESIGETTKNNLQSDIYAMVEGHVGLALHDVSGKNGVNTIVVNGVGKTKFTRRSTISGSNSRRPQSSPLPTSHLKNVAEASNESMNASGDNECTVNDKGVQIQDADNDGVSANGDTYKEQISKSTSAALPITSRSQAHHGMLSLPSQIIRSQFNQLGSDFAPDLNFHFSLVNGGARTSQDNIDSLQRTPSLISNRAVRGKRDEGSRAAVASTGIYVAVPTTVAGIMYRREGTDGLMKSGAVILGFAGVLAALEYSSFNSGMKEQRLKEQWIDYVMGYLQAKRDAIVEPIVSHFVDQAKMYISTITLLLNEQVVQMRGRLEKIMHTNDDIKEIVEQSAHVISRCEQLKIRMVDLASDIAMQE